MKTHTMYVCSRCGWGHYHPLSYCVRCPGRLVKRAVPHPYSRFETESDMIRHLASEGVDYIGEYPEVPAETKLSAQLARYQEHLLNAQLRCIMTSHRDGYHPERSVEFWKREIKKLKTS